MKAPTITLRLMTLSLPLLLAGCGSLVDGDTDPTVPPTSEDTQVPAATPTSPPASPTASAVPTFTATPEQPTPDPELERWQLEFFGVGLRFDADRWQLSEDPIPELQHSSLDGCILQEQGPTEYPQVEPERVRLGGIEFDVYRFEADGEDIRYGWYAAVGGFDNPQPGNTPIVTVTAPAQQFDPCLEAAEAVLGSLRPLD